MAGTRRAKSSTATRIATPARAQKKSTARSAKKTVAAPRTTRTPADKPLAAAAAAPLLATAPKKVGKVTGQTADAVKPSAPYQPRTDGAPAAAPNGKSRSAAATPAFDPLALALPWIQFGFQMSMSNLVLQARIARAAMDLPPTAAAMRQGSAAYKIWLAMLGGARPAGG